MPMNNLLTYYILAFVQSSFVQTKVIEPNFPLRSVSFNRCLRQFFFNYLFLISFLLPVNIVYKLLIDVGGSPGLVVMGRDLRSKGCGFESWQRILDGHFFTYICCKNYNDVCLKRPELNEKEAGLAHFFKKNS